MYLFEVVLILTICYRFHKLLVCSDVIMWTIPAEKKPTPVQLVCCV